MKLAIIHDYLDRQLGFGGGETEMKMLSEGLQNRGHNITFFCGYNDGFKIDVPIKEMGCFFRQPILKQMELAYRFSRLDLRDFDAEEFVDALFG